MKGDCGGQDGNGNGNSSEFQDGNGNGNFRETKFSRVTRLPVIILTRTVDLEVQQDDTLHTRPNLVTTFNRHTKTLVGRFGKITNPSIGGI